MTALDGKMSQAATRASDEDQGVQVDFRHIGELDPREPLSLLLKKSEK